MGAKRSVAGERRKAPESTARNKRTSAHPEEENKRANKQNKHTNTHTHTHTHQASARVERRKAYRRGLPPGRPSADSAERRIGAGTC